MTLEALFKTIFLKKVFGLWIKQRLLVWFCFLGTLLPFRNFQFHLNCLVHWESSFYSQSSTLARCWTQWTLSIHTHIEIHIVWSTSLESSASPLFVHFWSTLRYVMLSCYTNFSKVLMDMMTIFGNSIYLWGTSCISYSFSIVDAVNL